MFSKLLKQHKHRSQFNTEIKSNQINLFCHTFTLNCRHISCNGRSPEKHKFNGIAVNILLHRKCNGTKKREKLTDREHDRPQLKLNQSTITEFQWKSGFYLLSSAVAINSAVCSPPYHTVSLIKRRRTERCIPGRVLA